MQHLAIALINRRRATKTGFPKTVDLRTQWFMTIRWLVWQKGALASLPDADIHSKHNYNSIQFLCHKSKQEQNDNINNTISGFDVFFSPALILLIGDFIV